MTQVIGDHPVVANMMRTGTPNGIDPNWPTCPICGEECDTFFLVNGEIVGCEGCMRTVSAWDYWEGGNKD